MKKILVIVVMCLGITNVFAEPTPTVRWLMNEPVSLFDLGMYRLSLECDKWGVKFGDQLAMVLKIKLRNGPFVDVSYDWDNNRITFRTQIFPLNEVSEEEIVSIWNAFASAIDYSRGYEQSKLDRYEQRKTSLLTFFFNHIDYKSPDRPKDFEKNLSNIFIATVVISLVEEDMMIIAEGKFFDRQPAITRVKVPKRSDLD